MEELLMCYNLCHYVQPLTTLALAR